MGKLKIRYLVPAFVCTVHACCVDHANPKISKRLRMKGTDLRKSGAGPKFPTSRKFGCVHMTSRELVEEVLKFHL